MDRHTITEADLADHVAKHRQEWQRFAGSHGTGRDGTKTDKRLEFQIGEVAPIYCVRNFGEVVYVGALKETAVREYNALP